MKWKASMQLEPLLQYLHRETGLWFDRGRLQHVENGVHRAMQRRGFSRFERFQAFVRSHREVADDLIDELTVGETYFFRDPGHFELIQQTILPDLMQRKGPDHCPRLWSAGCASGEEPYSLAMVLAKLDLLHQSQLLATDISRRALAKADTGLYTPWSLRHCQSNPSVAHYLRSQADKFVLDSRIRDNVQFRCHNLALDNYPSLTSAIWSMDLILCRNVLIYFSQQTIAAVARRLFASLAPGGWLITGPSDPMLDAYAGWKTIVTRQGVVYRRCAETSQGCVQTPVKPVPVKPLPLNTAPAKPVSPPRTSYCQRTPLQPPRQKPAARPQRPSTPAGQLEQAREALKAGDFDRIAALRSVLCRSADGSALWAHAVANHRGSAAAEDVVGVLLRQFPSSAQLHLLRAVLLTDLGRVDEAERSIRRTLYLDDSLAIAHFMAGSIRLRRGDVNGAWKAYANSLDLCSAMPADNEVPLADGERAGRLAEAARVQLSRIRHENEMGARSA